MPRSFFVMILLPYVRVLGREICHTSDDALVLLWQSHIGLSSSSSCSLRVRCFPCSLVLKMELVPPSLLRSSNFPSFFWSVFQCLSWQSISVHPLYVLWPLFLVLFYFLYYILCSRFFPNTLILFFIQFCYF